MTITIQEDGIYERRDGVIVGPMHVLENGYAVCDGFGVNYGGAFWGQLNPREDPRDLIREIIVGPGWLPHNGGENPACGKKVYVIRRSFGGEATPSFVEWTWSATQKNEADILAYRIVEEAETASDDSLDAYKDLVGAPACIVVPDDAPGPRNGFKAKELVKLRADLPNEITIKRATNGGFIVRNSVALQLLAAVSNDADLLAWLTEEVTP